MFRANAVLLRIAIFSSDNRSRKIVGASVGAVLTHFALYKLGKPQIRKRP
jgi:hypothetical protein